MSIVSQFPGYSVSQDARQTPQRQVRTCTSTADETSTSTADETSTSTADETSTSTADETSTSTVGATAAKYTVFVVKRRGSLAMYFATYCGNT